MCVSLNVLLFVSFYGDAIFFSTVSDFLMKCKCTCLNKHIVFKANCDVQPTFYLWHLFFSDRLLVRDVSSGFRK